MRNYNDINRIKKLKPLILFILLSYCAVPQVLITIVIGEQEKQWKVPNIRRDVTSLLNNFH